MTSLLKIPSSELHTSVLVDDQTPIWGVAFTYKRIKCHSNPCIKYFSGKPCPKIHDNELVIPHGNDRILLRDGLTVAVLKNVRSKLTDEYKRTLGYDITEKPDSESSLNSRLTTTAQKLDSISPCDQGDKKQQITTVPIIAPKPQKKILIEACRYGTDCHRKHCFYDHPKPKKAEPSTILPAFFGLQASGSYTNNSGAENTPQTDLSIYSQHAQNSTQTTESWMSSNAENERDQKISIEDIEKTKRPIADPWSTENSHILESFVDLVSEND